MLMILGRRKLSNSHLRLIAVGAFLTVSLTMSATVAQEVARPATDATEESPKETTYFDLRRSKDRLKRQFAERYFNLVKMQEWSSDKGTKIRAKYVSHDADLKSVTLTVAKSNKEVTVPVARLSKTCQSRVRQIATVQKKLDELLVASDEQDEADRQQGGEQGVPMLDERGVEPRTNREPQEGFSPAGRDTREIVRRPAESPSDGSDDADPLGFGESSAGTSADARDPAGSALPGNDDSVSKQATPVDGAAAKPGNPAATVRAFLEAQKKGDVDAGLALLTDKARQKSGGQLTNGEVGPTARYRIEKAAIDGDTARVPVKLTDNGLTVPAQVRLRREAGQWRIMAMSLFAEEGEEGMTLDFENPDQQMTFGSESAGLPDQGDAVTTIPGRPGQFDQFKRFEQFGKPRVEPGRVTLEAPQTHGGFFGFAFSPDGETLAGGTGDIKAEVGGISQSTGGEIVIWNTRTGEIIKILGSHGAGVDWLAYSHDGQLLISASKDNGVIKIWNMEAGSAKQTIEVPGSKILAVAFSTDGKSVAVVAEKSRSFGKTTIKEGGELIVWDAGSGAKKWSLPDSNVREIAFSPDGQTMAAYSSKVANPKLDKEGNASWSFVEPRFTFFDAASGKENAKFDFKSAGNIKFIAFLPGTDHLAVAGMQGLRQLDIRTGQVQKEIAWDRDRWAFSAFAISSDGKTAARAWTDWVERMNVENGIIEGLRKVEFPNMLFNVVFAPDLKRMACSQQGAVIIDIEKLEPSG